MTYAMRHFVVVLALLAPLACGKDGGSTPSGDTTTGTTTGSTSSDGSTTTTETTIDPTTSSDDGNGPSCPFYAYVEPPPGNVGEPYEFIPEPTDEPKFWRVDYEAVVPGLTFGPMISGTPEAEGGFTLFASIVNDDGGVCQPQMFTLVIGPALPADTSGSSDSGSDSGSSSDGGSSSSSSTGV